MAKTDMRKTFGVFTTQSLKFGAFCRKMMILLIGTIDIFSHATFHFANKVQFQFTNFFTLYSRIWRHET